MRPYIDSIVSRVYLPNKTGVCEHHNSLQLRQVRVAVGQGKQRENKV